MFNLESYTIAAHLFPRLLGFVYFFAFGAFIFQIRGLIGKNGILPIHEFLDAIRRNYPRKKYYYVPSLFWINHSNYALMTVVILGTFLSVLLMAGIYPALILFMIYFLYLSIVSAGQDFLGFGWEGFMLEVTIHAFLLSLTTVPNLMVWLSVNTLLFRFHLQAGAVKLQSHDQSWRDLTAIGHHYQSQPLPNTVAWYIHKLPMSFHKISTLFMFFTELVVPFGIFGTETMRLIVFVLLFGLQFFIWATGNFSFLNYLSVTLCTILLNNQVLSHFMQAPDIVPTPLIVSIIVSILGGTLFTLQILRLWFHFFPNITLDKLFRSLSPFYIANRYGIFAVMTTTRYEIIVEGSDDGKNWKEYLFKYKPSEITRRPRRMSPYQPRIDWQAWFLPFSNFNTVGWFHRFLEHLLRGTPEVLKLIRQNPFPEHPPKYIRAITYIYEFSSFEEKKKHGWWWHRTLVGAYSPVLTLNPDKDLSSK